MKEVVIRSEVSEIQAAVVFVIILPRGGCLMSFSSDGAHSCSTFRRGLSLENSRDSSAFGLNLKNNRCLLVDDHNDTDGVENLNLAGVVQEEAGITAKWGSCSSRTSN